VTITALERLDEFVKRHADAKRPLASWAQIARGASWQNLQEVHQTLPHADGVKVASGRVVTVFNVRGNNYRLLTTIDYRVGVVNVLSVMTHAEYDKEKWKQTL